MRLLEPLLACPRLSVAPDSFADARKITQLMRFRLAATGYPVTWDAIGQILSTPWRFRRSTAGFDFVHLLSARYFAVPDAWRL